MKLYVDIFFAINVGMNLVVFLLETFFQKKKVKFLRLLLTSILGGGMAILFVLSGIHQIPMISIPIYLLGSMVLVRVAFGKTTLGGFIRNLLIYYTVGFIINGLLTQMQAVLGELPILGIFLALILLLWFVRRLVPMGEKWQEDVSHIFTVRLVYGGRRFCTSGLLDTGNQLVDPFSKQPVAICMRKDAESLFFQEEQPILRNIPFHSVGAIGGFLPAFQADYLEVKLKDGTWHRVNMPWIAMSDNFLSADGDYEIILHPQMIMNS